LVVGAVVVALVVGALLVRRGGEPVAPAAPDVAARGTPYLDGEYIRFSAAFAQREKLAFVSANDEVLTPTLQVTGAVAYDARRVAAISPLTNTDRSVTSAPAATSASSDPAHDSATSSGCGLR
ncbi:MAG TPA: hypothetical protein PK493_10925, partial [Pseudomonadota bacterium]|nr:hypothetical protein [Pseudomonadota bacterium]